MLQLFYIFLWRPTYHQIIEKNKVDMPLADWMMLSTLQSSANFLLPYTGNESTSWLSLDSWLSWMGGGTALSTIKEWLEATNLYDEVVVSSDYNKITQTAISSDCNEPDVILNLNPRLLDPGYFGRLDNHVMALVNPILVDGNTVSFDYWTWGQIDPIINGKALPTSFQKSEFESNFKYEIIAKKKSDGKSKCVKADDSNDPHLSTFDGFRYDLQSIGEFILVKSNKSKFEIQSRQLPYNSSASLAINSAVAIKVGRNRVALYAQGLPDADATTPLRVNGKPTTVQGDKLSLRGGGSILKQGGNYVISAPTGEKVLVSLSSNFLNVSPIVHNRAGNYSGLLGNVNGNPKDDLQMRGGKNVLEARSTYGDVKQVLNLTGLRLPGVLDRAEQVYFDQLYKEFANSWRVKQEESLFDYPPGKTTQSYVNPGFPDKYLTLNMLSADQIQKAQKACIEAKVTPDLMEGCIFDVGFSGFSGFARTTAEISGYIGIVNQLIPGLNIPTPGQVVDRAVDIIRPKICLPFIGCK